MLLQIEELKQHLEGLETPLKELGVSLDLEGKAAELARLESQSADPAFWEDMKASQKILKQISDIKDVLARYQKLQGAYEDAATLIEIALEEGDESMTEEITAAVAQVEEELQDQRLSTLLSGEFDGNNAILTFHAGAGGTEAQDWAEMLYRMYGRYAQRHGFKVKVLDYLDGEEAGLKSASILIEGQNAYGYLKGENGVHRLVRVSPFDSSGRRHTSFASLEVVPEIDDDLDVQIRDEDLRVDTYRSSGAGGQHVNKTESAIRITHLPTGIVVECQDERSQYKNKDKAMKVLRSRILEGEMRRQQEEIAAERRSQVGTGDRSERIRTYNYPQGRVTDHRIGLTLYKLEAILNGALDEIIDALITADQAEKLKAQD